MIDDYQQKKERKTFAIMCKAHWCSFPPFYGWYINQLDKILDSFLNLRIKNSTDSKYLYIVFVFIWFCMIFLFSYFRRLTFATIWANPDLFQMQFSPVMQYVYHASSFQLYTLSLFPRFLTQPFWTAPTWPTSRGRSFWTPQRTRLWKLTPPTEVNRPPRRRESVGGGQMSHRVKCHKQSIGIT